MGILRKILALILTLIGLFLMFVGFIGYFTWMKGGVGGVIALIIFWWLPLVFIVPGLLLIYIAAKLLRK